MIDLVEHMPDDHKVQLWSVWKEMTVRVKASVGIAVTGLSRDDTRIEDVFLGTLLHNRRTCLYNWGNYVI